MSGSIKEFSTYTLTSPLVKVGTFTDSKGKRITITKDDIKKMYDKITSTNPIIEQHVCDDIGGDPIASIQKYTLKDDGIYQKAVVTDVNKFESRYGNGHCFISPELEGSNTLIGAAFSSNPGMISEKVDVERHYFDAPPENETPPTPSWQEPLGELKSTISNLNNTLTNFGEQVKSMNSTTTKPEVTEPEPKTISMTVDDLAKYVKDEVSKTLSSMQSPTPEASETVSNEPEQPNEMAKQYAELLQKTQNLEAVQEKSYKKQFNAIVSELKALGIEHPEKMAPDTLDTEQRITILESIKENFARNSDIKAPLQETLASQQTKKSITVDDVLGHFDETFGSLDSAGSIRNDATMRNRLSNLSDPDLMKKYNMLQLFDTNGNYIGPL